VSLLVDAQLAAGAVSSARETVHRMASLAQRQSAPFLHGLAALAANSAWPSG
jgi:hypothetical protein